MIFNNGFFEIDNKDKLVDQREWGGIDGKPIVYIGMWAFVINDPIETNNGLYILTNSNFQDEDSWFMISTATNPSELFEPKLGNPAEDGYILYSTASGVRSWAAPPSGLGPHNLLSTSHPDTTTHTVARGDIIIGSGTTPKWSALSKGTAYQSLIMDGSALEPMWSSSIQSLLTARGSILSASDANTPAEITIGDEDNALVVSSDGKPMWKPSIYNILTTKGDILYCSGVDTISALGSSTETSGKQLIIGGAPYPEQVYVWVDSMYSLMTNTLDLIYASAPNTPARLARGTSHTCLTVNSTLDGFEWTQTLKGIFLQKGQMLFASDVNVPGTLAPGSAGQILAMDSSGEYPEWISVSTNFTSLPNLISIDSRTDTHTLNIGYGATVNAATRTINIGTGGLTGSTTNINIGSNSPATSLTNIRGDFKCSGIGDNGYLLIEDNTDYRTFELRSIDQSQQFGGDYYMTLNAEEGINFMADDYYGNGMISMVLGQLILPASTTDRSSLRLIPGSTPTSTDNGQIWVTSSGVYARVNGVNRQLDLDLTSHTHSADDITSGTLPVERGGTGINSFGGDAYLRAVNTTTLEAYTPAQVLADIGAAPVNHTHSTYDNTTTLSGDDVYSKITVTDGIVTGLTTRSLTPGDIGAALSGHDHDGTYAKHAFIYTDLNSVVTGAGYLNYGRYSSSATNKPYSVPDNANGLLTLNSYAGVYAKQISFGNDNDLYMRRVSNGTYYPWYKIWHSGSFDIANYVTTNTTQTIDGAKTFSTNVIVGSTTDSISDTKKITIQSKGYAGINIRGDVSNTSGEPGGAFVRLNVDGDAVQGILGLVQTAGYDGSGNAFTGTVINSVLLGNKYNAALQLGTNNTVRATIDSSGNFTLASGGVFNGNGSGLTNLVAKGQVSRTTISNDSTPNPIGSYEENEYYLTALTSAATFQTPSGTPANGNTLLLRVYSAATQVITFTTGYRALIPLPLNNPAGKTTYYGCIYNSADTKWDIVSCVQQL